MQTFVRHFKPEVINLYSQIRCKLRIFHTVRLLHPLSLTQEIATQSRDASNDHFNIRVFENTQERILKCADINETEN